MKTRKTGKIGEMAVKMFLMKRGYEILATNLRVYEGKQIGEIDILASKNNVLYMVEVKSTEFIDLRSGLISDQGSNTGNRWGRGDILTFQKYSKLAYTRRLFLAIRANCADTYVKMIASQGLFYTNKTKEETKTTTDTFLAKVKRIKIAFAEVTLLPNNKCNIEFHPINSGYY